MPWGFAGRPATGFRIPGLFAEERLMPIRTSVKYAAILVAASLAVSGA
jgi:hypothetical protein